MGDGSGSVVFVLRLCLLVSLQEKGTIILSTGMLAAADGEHLPT